MKESLAPDAPKTVLYVITKANWGGAQRYVFDLATSAAKAGHRVAVAYGEEGLLVSRLHDAGIRTFSVPALGRDIRIRKEYAAYRGLVALFRAERPDVVHINSSKAGALGALAARRAGIRRIIFTAHGWAFNEERPAWQKRLLRIASGITVLASHLTICVSHAIFKDICTFPFASQRTVILPHGVTPIPQTPKNTARETLLPHHQDAYWIGMVSELHPTKRIADAILAFAEIRDRLPKAILVVAGEGQERAELETGIAALGLTDRVFLLGFVRNMDAYLSAFDLFVHASQSEALGYAILEAGMAGLPVVATNVGGIPEIVENHVSGLLVPARAPHELAEAIRGLAENPTRAAGYALALHEHVRGAFNKERMVRETLSRY